MTTVYLTAFVLLTIATLREVNDIVKEPYMDEPFHVPQAQAYCAGNWSHWDNKITTPPGLYLYSILIQKLTSAQCSLPFLRSTCTLLLLLIPFIFSRFLSAHRSPLPSRASSTFILEATVLASFPILWFFAFLYYTEIPAVAFTVATFVFALKGHHLTASSLGLLACIIRQTNIIWVLYAFAYSQVTHFRFHRQGVLHDPLFRDATFIDIPLAAFSLLKQCPSIISHTFPYTVLLALFCGFVVWNGGIVLGDKANHIPVVHIPQLYYFYAFATAFGWPVLLAKPGGINSMCKGLRRMLFGSRSSVAFTTFALSIIILSIQKLTIHHPFLLSDNRHYTFYVWHRFFLFRPWAPLLYSPLYLVSCYAWLILIGDQQTLLQVILLPLILVPLLLPTPLLEPRYFLLPYIFLRAQVTDLPRKAVMLEGVWYMVINFVTMYVFLYAERPGVGRFMW